MQHPQLGALGFKDLNTLIMFYVMGMTNQPDFGLSSYVSEQASSTAMNSQQQARSTVRALANGCWVAGVLMDCIDETLRDSLIRSDDFD